MTHIKQTAELIPYRIKCEYCHRISIVYFDRGNREAVMEFCGWTCTAPSPQLVTRDVPANEAWS